MSAKTNFELMARYNQWMNEKIYEAASSLSETKIREDQGAFFKSILGTLNHLLVTDVLWLKRFAQHPKAYGSLRFLKNLANPGSLDEILYDDLGKLWEVRREFDVAIRRWSKEVEIEEPNRDLEYANSKGDRFANDFGELVQHYFNHQTHHRGQISTLLFQKGIDIGSTDLLTLIRA